MGNRLTREQAVNLCSWCKLSDGLPDSYYAHTNTSLDRLVSFEWPRMLYDVIVFITHLSMSYEETADLMCVSVEDVANAMQRLIIYVTRTIDTPTAAELKEEKEKRRTRARSGKFCDLLIEDKERLRQDEIARSTHALQNVYAKSPNEKPFVLLTPFTGKYEWNNFFVEVLTPSTVVEKLVLFYGYNVRFADGRLLTVGDLFTLSDVAIRGLLGFSTDDVVSGFFVDLFIVAVRELQDSSL